MADDLKPKPAITQELAPSTDNASLIANPYLKVMANPDGVLTTKGAGDFKVYAEVLRDDTVKSTFQQRRLAVVSSEWDVEAGAEDAVSTAAAEALKAQLQALNFDDITDKMLYAVYYGYGVAEVMWGTRDGLVSIEGVKVRDRGRFRFGVDGSLFLRKVDGSYEAMPDRKFWTISTGQDTSDNPYGLGLAHWLYWPVYFKRSDIKFWLVFLEKFGQPTPIGKMPAGHAENVESRKKLLAALRAISTESAVVVPEGAEIELLEASRSGSATYEEMKSAMDAAIAKIVLSQTMTTEAVGGQYKADVHKDVRDEVVKADADLVCETFNRSVVKWWTEYNFPNAVPPRVWRKTEPEQDLNELADRDAKIYAMGFEPTEDYIKATYGEGWVKRKEPQPTAGNPNDPNAQNFGEAQGSMVRRKARLHDAQDLIEAGAARKGGDWQRMIGPRVQQLLGMLEQTKDLVTFRERMTALFEEDPAPENVDAFAQAMFAATLIGRGSQQRDEIVKFAEAITEQTAATREMIAAFAQQPDPVVNIGAPVVNVSLPEPKPISVEYDENGLIKTIN